MDFPIFLYFSWLCTALCFGQEQSLFSIVLLLSNNESIDFSIDHTMHILPVFLLNCTFIFVFVLSLPKLKAFSVLYAVVMLHLNLLC